MRKLIIFIFFSSLLTGACYAGADFKQECNRYFGSTYKDNQSLTGIFSLKIDNEYYPVTVGIGDDKYSISRDNDKVYQFAVIAYLFDLNVNICAKKIARDNIVELLGMDMVN